MHPTRLLLLVTALLSSALPLRAATYVPISDGTLVDRAPLIAVVEVQAVDEVGKSRPATDYAVRVRRALKGEPPPGDFIVRVPGGVGPDGRKLRIHGAPSLVSGERVLLFLSPRPDGTYGVFQLFLGAFHEVPAEGRRLAMRRLGGTRALGRNAPSEPIRDFERFADWIEARARGVRSAVGYEVAVSGSEILQAVEPFNFFNDGTIAYRWFAFDGGGSVAWRAHQGGQPGLSGGGFAEFQTALAAWTGDPGSRINYVYAGTTPSTGGFTQPDGINGVLFDDPNGDIGGPFDCSGGGILAIGGFWDDSSLLGTFSGLTYFVIPEGDIITNRNVGCYLADGSPPSQVAEELFAHELGHTLGLAHSQDSTALMNPFIHNDGRGARLETDERRAAGFLYRADLDFHTLGPCRLYDSRSGSPLAAGEQRLIPANGTCGVPQAARALAVNVTVVTPSSDGYLTLFPSSETAPLVSALNFRAGLTRSNNAVVALSAIAKSFRIRPGLPPGGTVHVTVDVTGYFE
jgi:hypothetical protein